MKLPFQNLFQTIKMVTPYNIRNFVQGTYNKLREDSKFLELHGNIKEQSLYRASLCHECTSNGECFYCGCKTPDMFYSPLKVCSKSKWGVMLSDDDWEIYKQIGCKSFKALAVNYDKENGKIIFDMVRAHDLKEYPYKHLFINFLKVFDYVIVQDGFAFKVLTAGNEQEFKEHYDNLELLKKHYVDKDVELVKANKDIYIEPMVCEFGSVQVGSKAAGTFTLRNNTDNVLFIQSIVPACGCTTPSLSSNILKAYSQQEFSLILDTKGYTNLVSKKAVVNVKNETTGENHEFTITLQGIIK
jgi:hypothetical protein